MRSRTRAAKKSGPPRSCRTSNSDRPIRSYFAPFDDRRFDRTPATQRTRQRPAIDELELAADGHAVGNATRWQPIALREHGDEVSGRIALHGNAGRKHDLREGLVPKTLLEQLEPELARPHAVDRREMAHQHEVAAAISAG